MKHRRHAATLILSLSALASAAAAEDQCPLASPAALLSEEASGVVHHTFELSAPREATEVAFLKGGESFIIRHRGCEYQVLTILVNTKLHSPLSREARYGYRHAATNLVKLADLSPKYAPLFRRAANALLAATGSRSAPTYEKALSLSEVEGLTASVTLVEAGGKGAEYHSLIELSQGRL